MKANSQPLKNVNKNPNPLTKYNQSSISTDSTANEFKHTEMKHLGEEKKPVPEYVEGFFPCHFPPNKAVCLIRQQECVRDDLKYMGGIWWVTCKNKGT